MSGFNYKSNLLLNPQFEDNHRERLKQGFGGKNPLSLLISWLRLA